MKLVGTATPGPADRTADHPVRGPAAEPADRIQPPFLRRRARDPGDADPVRHLRGRIDVRALGRRPRDPERDPVLRDRNRARRSPCPPATREFHPTFSAASTGNGAGTFSPFTVDLESQRRRPEPQRPHGRDAARVHRQHRRRSLLLRRGARRPEASASYSGISELQIADLPGLRDRDRDRGRRRRLAPGLPAGHGLPRRPLQGRAPQPRLRHPGGLGPLRPRQRRRQNRGQGRPAHRRRSPRSHDPLPQIFEGIPLRLRSIQIRLDRPNFALNPTNCSQFNVGGAITGDQGTEVDLASHYQVANCRLMPYKPALEPEAHRRPQPPRPPGTARDAALEVR